MTSTRNMHRIACVLLPLLLLLITHELSAQALSSYDQAVAAIEAQDFAKAKTLLFKALSEGADKGETWYALGYVAQHTADFDLMVKAGREISKFAPDKSDGWYMMAIGHYQRGTVDSAVAPIRELMRVDRPLADSSNLSNLLEVMSQDVKGARDSVYATPGGKVKLTLPASWSTKHVDDEKTMNWFISLEPIQSDSDMYSTGVSVRWIRWMSASFPKLTDEKNTSTIVKFWRDFEKLQQIDPYKRTVLDSSAITIGAWKGEMLTIRMQLFEQSYELMKIDIALARKDEVLTIVMECPARYWPVYVERFKRALKTAVLPK
jgi:tetratricopeptide (TPR) repeat protein